MLLFFFWAPSYGERGAVAVIDPLFRGDWQDELDFVGKHVSHNRPNSDLISLAAGRHAMWSRSSTIPHIPHSSLEKMLRVCNYRNKGVANIHTSSVSSKLLMMEIG